VTTTIKLPELGENVDSGELTKILVSPGETISKDQALLELETDKATIEVPSPVSGVIKELHVQEGRTIKVGDLLFTVEENGGAVKPKEKPQRETQVQRPRAQEQAASPPPSQATGPASAQAAGAAAQPRKTEAQKKPEARIEAQSESKSAPAAPKPEPKPERREPPRAEQEPAVRAEARAEAGGEAPAGDERETRGEGEREETVIPFPAETSEPVRRPGQLAPASPSIRRLARELGVDINRVQGTGSEGRIDEQDVKAYAREIISRSAGGRVGAEPVPELPDFAKWGRIERKPMSNVRRATAEHLAQAWHNVPQVTQFDSADVTELENLRSRFSEQQESGGAKITVTAIALKVVAAALQKFPQFAASIDVANREIIYKRYCNIGVAVDTNYGLVVPVVRDADQKSIPQLATELTELSERAREKKLSLEEMAGGVFTITNLGGIGGTGFSPIVNYPEVAILGISRLAVEPRHVEGADGGPFQPRKILPISLSYDHRLIDGADAARFLRWVAGALEQPVLLLFGA
jgi:pyruvate dehydrogenase E2 component (dihydrolipoamide acetyltransferase)